MTTPRLTRRRLLALSGALAWGGLARLAAPPDEPPGQAKRTPTATANAATATRGTRTATATAGATATTRATPPPGRATFGTALFGAATFGG